MEIRVIPHESRHPQWNKQMISDLQSIYDSQRRSRYPIILMTTVEQNVPEYVVQILLTEGKSDIAFRLIRDSLLLTAHRIILESFPDSWYGVLNFSGSPVVIPEKVDTGCMVLRESRKYLRDEQDYQKRKYLVDIQPGVISASTDMWIDGLSEIYSAYLQLEKL